MKRSLGWAAVLLLVSLGLVGCLNVKTPDLYVSGTVVDKDTGLGVGGVQIDVNPGGTTVTSADGGWSLLRAKKGSKVTASKDGWIIQPESQNVKGEGDVLTFVAERVPFSVSGRVANDRGFGLADVLVIFANTGGEVVGTVRTQVDGSFSKSGFKGTYIVTAFKEGWLFTPTEYVVSGEGQEMFFYGSPVPEPGE